MRVRLFGQPGVQGAARRRARSRARQQQPGDDHDRPGSGGSHLRRAAHTRDPGGDHRAGAPGRAAADRRRADRAQPGRRPRGGRHAREVPRRAHRRLDPGDQGGRRSAAVQGRHAGDRPRRPAKRPRAHAARGGRAGAVARLSDRDPPLVHARRRRRRHCVQHRGIPRAGRTRPRAEPGPRSADRRVGDRLEGIRARGDARRRRQLRRHLLDREHRSDGRPHGRQHHRRADPDADGQGISADARRRAEDHPPRRGRDRRVQHSVRRQSGQRPDDRHRDEPARLEVVGAGVEGHGIPDREDRGQAGARLSPRRNPERHHAPDAGLLRAHHRLRRRQDPALELREVPAGRSDADDADEVGRARRWRSAGRSRKRS